ncbi:MAG: adenosylcobinamide-phosphate synthase CbiB [Pseudomonadota bacterium]
MTLILAMILDAAFGEDDNLRFGLRHPVVVIGDLLTWFERHLNHGNHRRLKGMLALLLLLAIGLAVPIAVSLWMYGWVLEILIAAILIAHTSLVDHVKAVANGLRQSLADGRRAVSMIVGRDPESLDEAGVARAAIESAAENFSDGVVAPIFWFAVAGLPGIAAYKIVNTADSMIGHRNDRYLEFGWASARLDDLLNIIPARLTGFLFAVVSGNKAAVPVMFRDAPGHRSPNAGWPESAMAALLGVALAGPRQYGDQIVDDPYMYAEGRRETTADDIDRAISILWRAWSLMLGLAIAYTALFWRPL